MGRKRIPDSQKKVGRGVSIPPQLEAEIEQVALAEDRKWNDVLVKLAQRGLSLYEKDGILFEKLEYRKPKQAMTPPDDDHIA